MAILHGTWIINRENQENSGFFIWGEIWRSLENQQIKLEDETNDIIEYPQGMTTTELENWLRKCQLINLSKSHINADKILNLPTYLIENRKGKITEIYTFNSADDSENKETKYLHPWKITGFHLPVKLTAQFLTNLPLNTNSQQGELLGEDIKFWIHIARWSLDLIARGKFLPTIEKQEDERLISKWQVIIDSSIDNQRLQKFAQKMPLSCRCYQENSNLAVELPILARELIIEFLNHIIDSQIRMMINSQSPIEAKSIASLPTSIKEWLLSLTNNTNTTNYLDPINGERLKTTLTAWMLPLESQLTETSEFRTCLQLYPPTDTEKNWKLVYYLQAIDNSEFIIDAHTIWQNPVSELVYNHRTVVQPQETFLRGLGLASRIYPMISESLETENPECCDLTPVEAYQFIKSIVWKLEDSGIGVILPSSLMQKDGFANRLGLKLTSVNHDKKQGSLGLQSLLNFQWQLTIGGQTISKKQFDKLVALNSPLVEINGEWVELRSQDVKTAQNFFVSRQEQMSLSLEDALRISTGDTQIIEKLPVVSFETSGILQELISTLTNNQEIQSLPTPVNFKGELRPYQQRGVGWLTFLEKWGLGACLADDMGLGKTVELIAFLLHLQQENKLEKPTLLVCPTSVLGNWEREIKKFAPNLKVLQYHGDKRPKGRLFSTIVHKYDLVITSYSLVHRDLSELESINWQMVVLDEAQNVKNHESKQSQAVRKLKTTFRMALTGTPVENRLQELWSILEFLNPGYLGNKQFFQRRFAIPIEKYGDSASLNQLRSLVKPFILRRLKTDKTIIQDLPEKQEMNVFCGLSTEQATLYQNLVEESLQEIDSAEGLQRRGMILGLLVKLKQICNHPAQYLKLSSLEKHHSAKLQRLEEMLEEVLAAKDKALIFTQFAEWGKLLKPHLEKQFNREIFFLYGSTTKKQREEMIDRFQNDPQAPPIMILSLKAGGVGLNLTKANHVFHFDRWWNPAVENQATDRVFRIGQTRNVQVHKFVCTGTLEEKINEMIEGKKQLAQQVVSNGEDWLTEMDTDQLRNLLILDRNTIIEEDDTAHSI